MLLAAVLFCGASLLAPAPEPRAEGLAEPLPVLREVNVELVFPGQPELGILTVTMFLPEAEAEPGLLEAGRQSVLARFPGAVELLPGEVSPQYRVDNVRWPSPGASWKYNPYEPSTRIGAAAAFAAITAGANGWTNAGGSGFQFSFDGYTGTPPGCDGTVGNVPKDGENVVGWGHIAAGFWGFTCWWKSLESVPGTSFKALTEFDIVFESSSGVPYTPAVMKALALHEFGHALGLAHTQESHCPGVVMCGGTAATIQQAITPDDVAGVLSLYGAAPAPTPTPGPSATPTPTPPLFPPGGPKHSSRLPGVARD